MKLRLLADAGEAAAERVLLLQDSPGHFFTVVQIGLNAVAILGGVVGEQALSPHVRAALQPVYDGPQLDTVSFLVAFVLRRIDFIELGPGILVRLRRFLGFVVRLDARRGLRSGIELGSRDIRLRRARSGCQLGFRRGVEHGAAFRAEDRDALQVVVSAVATAAATLHPARNRAHGCSPACPTVISARRADW